MGLRSSEGGGSAPLFVNPSHYVYLEDTWLVRPNPSEYLLPILRIGQSHTPLGSILLGLSETRVEVNTKS